MRENHTQISTTFKIFLEQNVIGMFLRNVHVYVSGILFNNDVHDISFNSAEKWHRNMTFSHNSGTDEHE